MAIDENLKTCVVFGGRGFIGRFLVLRLLKLGKWIVRVADSAQSLQLDPSEDRSVLSEAISSGRASCCAVDVRDKAQVRKGDQFFCRFYDVSFCLVPVKMQERHGQKENLVLIVTLLYCLRPEKVKKLH